MLGRALQLASSPLELPASLAGVVSSIACQLVDVAQITRAGCARVTMELARFLRPLSPGTWAGCRAAKPLVLSVVKPCRGADGKSERRSLRSHGFENPPSMGGDFVRSWSAAGSRFNAAGLTTGYAFVRAGLLGTSGLLIVVPAWWPPRAARFVRQLCRSIGRRPERGGRWSGGAACRASSLPVCSLEYMTPSDLTS